MENNTSLQMLEALDEYFFADNVCAVNCQTPQNTERAHTVTTKSSEPGLGININRPKK